MNIQVIPTQYKGYTFRSRTEARWAVFFDTLGWKWQYEAEGYSLPSGYYLPDFYFPDVYIFAEVKGKEFTELEELKCKELSHLTFKTGTYEFAHTVLMLDGQPERKSYYQYCDGVRGKDYCSVMMCHPDCKFYPLDYCNEWSEDSKVIKAIEKSLSYKF